ncbi:MAG: hypothetical protein ABFR33_11175 [Verrucomicrobiota bacterium]
MKKMMKKLLVLAVLMAVGVVQADHFYWWGGRIGGDGFTWGESGTNNFHHAQLGAGATNLPGSADHVIIDENWTAPYPGNGSMPKISSDVGEIGWFTPGWGFAGTSGLTILDGGSLRVPAGGFARLGHIIDSVGFLDMQGGYMLADVLHVGFNSVAENTGGSGIVNLSGNAVLHVGSLGFGQGFDDYATGTAQDGTGEIHMSENAKLFVNGDQTITGTTNAVNWIADGWIDAHGIAGSSVVATYTTNGWTEFALDVPAPAPYLFYDSFDADDADHVNADIYGRQVNSKILSAYSGNPTLHSITNNKLNVYWPSAFANVDFDFAPYIVGEDFEFSVKAKNNMGTSGNWMDIYMTDGTVDAGGDPEGRVSSRFSLSFSETNFVWSFAVSYGTGATREIDHIYLNHYPELNPFDKAAEHTYRLVSTAGEGGTNTFEIYVDGVEITDGVTPSTDTPGNPPIPDAYTNYFDGPERRISIVGDTGNTDKTTSILFDDLYLQLIEGITYADWVEDWGLTGSDTNRTADIEPDGMDNLLEYALGSNPLVDDAASFLPVFSGPVDVGGTNYMDYIYRRRNDAGARGLTYDVQFKTDLVSGGDWNSTMGMGESETSAINSEIEEVTVTIPTIVDLSTNVGFEAWVWDERLFLNLEVTED